MGKCQISKYLLLVLLVFYRFLYSCSPSSHLYVPLFCMTSFEQLGFVNILPSCKNNVVTYVFMWVLDTTCKLPSILFFIKANQSGKKRKHWIVLYFCTERWWRKIYRPVRQAACNKERKHDKVLRQKVWVNLILIFVRLNCFAWSFLNEAHLY
jgi:hypothetical protein